MAYLQSGMVAIKIADQKRNNWGIVDFSNLGIGDDQLIAQVLPVIRSCKSIDLSCNRIHDKGAQQLALALLNEYVLLDPATTPSSSSSSTSPSLSTSSQLATLRLDHNQIGDTGARELAKLLKLPELNHLTLAWTSVSVVGVTAIAEKLKYSSLKHLFLDGNGSVGDQGLVEIGHSLMESQLVTLSMVATRITDSGFSKFVSYLPQSQIRHLLLSGNFITSEALDVLADVVLQTKLERLNLSQNKIRGDVYLFSSKIKHSTLRSIDLSGNKIDEAGARNLINAARGSYIRDIYLHWNGLSNATLKEMHAVLDFPRSEVFKILITLYSANTRVGVRSPLRILPSDLVRNVVRTLFPILKLQTT
jgi:Ran GTPase-activating protein (RanGAP) involved in mRNA processing and transport